MILYKPVHLAFFGHALAQSFDPATGLILGGFSSSASAGDDSLISGGGTSALILSSDVTEFGGQPTGTTIPASTSAAITSLALSTSSYSLSGTLRLVTDATDVLLSTLASTATPTVSPSASANGVMNSDRVAVIALASILGALVVALAVVIPVWIRRRKARQANQKRSPNHQSRATKPTKSTRQRPASWLGSFRRSRPTDRQSSFPRQQYANAPSQPLMSEGSPRYGFHSPHEARPPPPLFAGASRGQRRDSPNDPTAGINRNDIKTINAGEPEAAGTLSVAAATGTTPKTERQTNEFARPSSEHDAGNPYVDANPKTPKLYQDQSKSAGSESHTAQGHGNGGEHAPLASHPVIHASPSGQSGGTEGPTDAEEQRTDRSFSIPREGFANAIAGFGIDADDVPEGASKHSVVAESTKSTTDEALNDETGTDVQKPQTVMPPALVNAGDRRGPASRVPHLKIPQSLMPGRQKSKKTRFSVADNEEVSPTSESWLGADDAEQGLYRRPSTISPVSPERNERRVRSEFLARRRSSKRGGERQPVAGTLSAPAASSTQPVQIAEDRAARRESRKTMTPGVHHIRHTDELPNQDPDYLQVPAPQRSSVARSNVKRKPVPLDLGALIRKPLPPHPVPTSKYNQAARQSTNPQAAHPPSQTKDLAPKYENTGNSSSKLKGDQPSRIPRVATPLAYDQGYKNSSEAKGKGRAPTPLSEPADNSTIISGYMQPPSHQVVTNTSSTGQHRQPDQAGPSTSNKRDTVQFFDDPGNREYAQVYGSYYSQPSPVQFISPVSPGAPPFVYPPVAPYIYPGYQQQQHQQYYQPQQHYERSRYIPPPLPTQQQQLQAQPRSYPTYHHDPYSSAQAGYQQPRLQPSVTLTNLRPAADPERLTGLPAAVTTSHTWRDSQQDAWRDSLSRSGSDPTNKSESGNGVAASNASSGGGGGPGLWGSPGFFGVDR